MQKWTKKVLSLLPATTRELNTTPAIVKMNKAHRAERVARGSWARPVNSMVFDTLVRLEHRGIVVRGEDGVYKIINQGKTK